MAAATDRQGIGKIDLRPAILLAVSQLGQAGQAVDGGNGLSRLLETGQLSQDLVTDFTE